MAMLAVVFFCLIYAAYVAYITWKKIGCSNQVVSTLSVVIVVFLGLKFVDNAIMLRIASDHDDISACFKAYLFAFSHLFLVFACYYNTATWIKFTLTLECVAKGTEQYFGEMMRFLWAFFAVLCLLTTALFFVSALQECEFEVGQVRLVISYN